MTTAHGSEPTRLANWSGNHAYRATQVHRPSSVDELRAIVARAPKIHALGTRHCFNDIADSAELITLDGIDPDIVIDRDAQTVTVNPGIRYGDLARALEREGLALHNMASLPHISVGGAVATATHGSGDANGNLATAVVRARTGHQRRRPRAGLARGRRLRRDGRGPRGVGGGDPADARCPAQPISCSKRSLSTWPGMCCSTSSMR